MHGTAQNEYKLLMHQSIYFSFLTYTFERGPEHAPATYYSNSQPETNIFFTLLIHFRLKDDKCQGPMLAN